MGASMIQPCNGCNTVDYNGELDDAGRCAECASAPSVASIIWNEFCNPDTDDQDARGTGFERGSWNHAYANSGKVIATNDKAMTVAYGYGCKVCGRLILDRAHD